MTQTTDTKHAAPDLTPEQIRYQEILHRQRQRANRALLKRRQKKSNQ